MKQAFRIVAAVALIVGALLTPARALAQVPVPGAPLYTQPAQADGSGIVSESAGRYFIELTQAPLAEGGSLSALQTEKSNLRAEMVRQGVQFTQSYAFNNLWNGLSGSISADDLAKVKRMAGVKAVYPILQFAAPEQPINLPELTTALAMTGADVAQNELGLTGKGVKVAVMDTGIDFDHPDLGGCFGPGCRVAYGYDFVGDAYDAETNPVTVPDMIPDDCAGHGTHVAGIIGANGLVKGVAPEVTFGAYRVFGCEGSTDSDIMLAAMEAALNDGMQVLNMSIGSSFQWPQYPTAQAADRLVVKGMVVVASIGNSGADGAWSAGAPGVGKKVIGVASFDNTATNANVFLANGQTPIGWLPLADTAIVPSTGVSPEVVFVGRGCNTDAYLGNPNGKVALIERGACTFNEKYQRAVTNGAVGVVIYNSAAGGGIFAGGGVIDSGVWGATIGRPDGLALVSMLTSGPVTLTFTDQVLSVQNPTGGLISSFSSYGLSPDLTLKPDLGAPGGLIRSTYPLEKGGYAILSGTSMASPHVAGAAALLLQAKPRTPAQAVLGIFQNTANPADWFGYPGAGYLDNVHRQGAGMIDIVQAVQTTASIDPSKLALGESEAGPSTQTLRIKNSSPKPVTYNLFHSPALATTGTFTVDFWDAYADVTFSADSVTVPPFSVRSVTATITAPDLPGAQYGGYLVAVNATTEEVLSVPYAGYAGDYQAIVAMDDAFVTNLNWDDLTSGGTFTLQNGDLPQFWFHMAHGARQVTFEVNDAHTGKAWYRAYAEDYIGRNSGSMAAGTYYLFQWDGSTVAGKSTIYNVPDGDYVVTVKTLKALGNPNNPAHWETWTSPVITIDRP